MEVDFMQAKHIEEKRPEQAILRQKCTERETVKL